VHGLTTGDRVIVAGVRGNTAANGTRTITVTAANKFILNGSAGNGSYIAGGEIRAGSMGYYDSETTAAASLALGHALPVFTCQDDDPDAFHAGADAAWLAGRLKSHIDTIRGYVLADFPAAKFELLFPYDVNHPNCYHTLDLPFPQGGRMNARVNLPSAYLTKIGSGLDRMKVEALSWGSFYRNSDRAKDSIEFPFTAPQSWSKADIAYLVPIFNGGAPWPAEYLMARNSGVPLINFWAFDHICLLSWPLPLPKNSADAKFV
jgi:hypothetical protein